MSDPTLRIRIQHRIDGKPVAARTVDVTVLPALPAEGLASRAGRRVENAVLEILEDAGHSPSNAPTSEE